MIQGAAEKVAGTNFCPERTNYEKDGMLDGPAGSHCSAAGCANAAGHQQGLSGGM
jgi:hypothetical protein